MPRRLLRWLNLGALLSIFLAVGCMAGCESGGPFVPPDHVGVEYVLIGFQGSVKGTTITRTQDEAQALAQQLVLRARMGENFDFLVGTYSDDPRRGIFWEANTGVTSGPDEFSRASLVKNFGDVSFSLRVGQIGLAGYDARDCPYGWFVIKRLK